MAVRGVDRCGLFDLHDLFNLRLEGRAICWRRIAARLLFAVDLTALVFPLQPVQLQCCLLLTEGVRDLTPGNRQHHASPFRICQGRQNFEEGLRDCGVGDLGGVVDGLQHRDVHGLLHLQHFVRL